MVLKNAAGDGSKCPFTDIAMTSGQSWMWVQFSCPDPTRPTSEVTQPDPTHLARLSVVDYASP